MIRRLLARILSARSHCAGCGRPWFSDKRQPCPCGSTARTVGRSLSDAVVPDDRVG